MKDIQGLDRGRTIHFSGIGGTGMSGLASVLISMGYSVAGSDKMKSQVLERLSRLGARIWVPQDAANLLSDTQLVVASAAIRDDNPEIMAARARGIPIIKYAAMLGRIMDAHRGIAIAGTHGKTTTTAMMVYCMKRANLMPSFVIGGMVPQLGGGSGAGKGEFLVAEACEYDRSFLNLRPECAIINNIEEDHLDYYSGIEEIIQAFHQFALNIRRDGALCISADSENIKKALQGVDRRIITYGVDEINDVEARNINFGPNGSNYDLFVEGQKCARVRLKVFGMHNVINSLATIAACREIGMEPAFSAMALSEFEGVGRRYEKLLDTEQYTIIDDYAHHPTEIKTVLKYARLAMPKRRIIAVFQPHQHSRTRFLLKDFALSFSDVDQVVVPDIYFVRDSDMEKSMVHAKNLVREIVGRGGHAWYIPSFDEIVSFLHNNMVEGDVIITMGAGNVCDVAHKLKALVSQ